jgi:hypothetical protein
MALTEFQRRVCRLLADERKRSGESYVAGGLALNELLAGHRRSKDIDLFHDAQAALAAAWANDQAALARAGLAIRIIRELPSFIEAHISHGSDTTLIQWVHDSAYRFFPLVEHPELGLTMHPVDLATNKILAVVGRHEPRDWIDILHCDLTVQPLGYLAWAATGKDPGLSPAAIIEEAARTHYNQSEIDDLHFDGPAPDAAALSAQWHRAITDARKLIALLPFEQIGKVVLDGLDLARAEPAALPARTAQLTFHEGRIRGAFPEVREPPAAPLAKPSGPHER